MASFEEHVDGAGRCGGTARSEGSCRSHESVRLFEEGVKLSEACKKELEAAEGRIQVLVERGRGLGGGGLGGGRVR